MVIHNFVIAITKMRTIRYALVLGLLFVFISGCTVLDTLPPYYYYQFIGIGIADSSGNDLVAPLGDEQWIPVNERSTKWHGTINPERYDLSIVSDNTVWKEQKMEERERLKGPYFWMEENSEDYAGYLLMNVYMNVSEKESFKLDNQLTYRFTCPEIFGDDAEHIIETYWYAKERTGHSTFLGCTKAVFEGKELAIEKMDDRHVYFVNIVLDK